MKKKSTLLTEAIARATLRKEENKKADPLVQAIKCNDENLRKAWEQFWNK